MDQEDTLDFEALRAKFQDQELLLKQPKFKPALPEKPKVVPPPQSPPHFLPAGARPSLLTSISQSLEGKTAVAPRVVFKDAKKESKKSLIQIDKSEGKLKKSKDKATSASKEKLDEDPSDQKPKKENGKDKRFSLGLPVAPKESAAELVPAMPPPKAPTTTKKGFLGFKKSSKKDSLHISAPILDAPSSDDPGPAPLIPVPTNFGDAPPEPEISRPKVLLPNIPTLPDSSAAVEITPPPTIPASPDFNPPPAFIPDIPAPLDPTPESETPPEIETPALPVSRPASQNEIIQSPPSALSTPPPSRAITGPPPVASSPSPTPPEPDVGIEAVDIANMEIPPPPVIDAPSIPPSPKAERPISALSALERAEDMSPGKRTPTCDQRIFNALEKARRKTTSPQTSSTTSYSITPPPEELPQSQSPTTSLPDLPPIDYEDRAGKPAQVNGFDHRQASPVLEGIAEERPDPIPELLVLPPPPPRKVHTDPQPLNPAPEKPHRPLSVNPSDFIPPPLLENNEITAPEFSETDTMNVPEFDNLASDAHSPELPVSEWGNEGYTGADTPDGQNLKDFYSNGINTPGAGAAPAYGDEVPALPESSLPISQEYPPQAGLQVDNGNYESTENVYETINMSNAKKKSGGKKRKGPPKNPYAEAAPETSEEKSKTGRFGKSDKKAAAEGPDEKELKKKEKQRLEKEKKELKEKQEREKKEQKEREKKENELKKKFKIIGHEDAMYEAKVTVTTKGRKDDLPVKTGDVISIIRTTNCPKGKWLARDSSNNYGYVAVDHVELDIKEMLELGKKAATTHKSGSNAVEAEVISTGSRASNHYPLSAESFTDDSEEWTGDDDEPLSPAPENPLAPVSHARTVSMPEMGMQDVSVNHQHSQSDISADGPYVQARHEALQKLATFFHSPKPVEPEPSSTEPETSPVIVNAESVQLTKSSQAEETGFVQLPNSAQEMDFDLSDMLILPPPDLYADKAME